MKTLNKKYTSQFFNDESGYQKLVERWSQLVNSEEGKSLTSADFLLYLMLRGKDYTKAFLPGRKMQDYNWPEGLWVARTYYFYSVEKFKKLFDDILIAGWDSKLRKLMPSMGSNIYEVDPYIDEEVEKLLNDGPEQKIVMVQPAIEKSQTFMQKMFHRG